MNDMNEMPEAERLLRLILPMAKGYAAAHPVGSNKQYVEDAEAWLRARVSFEATVTL